MDQLRLSVEANEMRRLFPNFTLGVDSYGRPCWRGSIGGMQFRIEYPFSYPYAEPEVYETPWLATRHHIGNRLCIMESVEWSSNFTAATVVGILIRFLDEYRRGLTE